MSINRHKIAFSLLRGINPSLAETLLARIGSEEQFFSATESQLSAVMSGKNRMFAQSYRDELLVKAECEEQFIEANHITPLYFTNPDFPTRLRECDDAPIMLYALGDCNLNARHMVSIVGTRHATPYGIDFTTGLIEDLAKKLDDVVIVSGLAYGIDVAAHRAALRCGVPTVGVLAHGLNTIYPTTHRQVAAEMARSGGGLITDYTSQDTLHKGNFLARNRIVAGMCDCTIVAESAIKGGAIVTAGIAASYGRDVAALPGRTSDRFSQGCNKLIADNVAALISDADSLIAMMQWAPRPQEGEQSSLFVELLPEEGAVMDHLSELGESDINRMSVAVGIPMSRLMPMLVDMEFKGLILTYPGGKYRLA